MKISFFNLFFFVFLFELNAQSIPVVKIYGYKQQLFQGKKTSKNEPIKKTEQYKLFVEYRKNSSINITEVWIQSNYFRFTTHPKLKSPILDVQQPANKQILVPKTTNRIIEIDLTNKQEPSPRPTAALGKLLQSNDVVISYLFKGKTYFATLKKMIALEPFDGM
jgi:hypothetical protein